jgi:uncharacterized GH25 family protein
MKRPFFGIFSAVAFVCVMAGSLAAHDLFLKPDSFFLRPNSVVPVRAINGTFTTSAGAVTSDRLRHSAIIGGGSSSALIPADWDTANNMSTWTVRTGGPGTYLISASLLPRTIKLTGAEFNEYLESDGLPDILSARRKSGELGKSAHERYSKHVKTLLQVGSLRSERVDTVFGYPAEIVALDNPYRLRPGSSMRIRALVDGSPVANQYLIAGGRTVSGGRIEAVGFRTDKDGNARVRLSRAGTWYVKFINMKRIDPAAGDSVDYESKWATLTFAVR